MTVEIKTINKGTLEDCGYVGRNLDEVYIGEYVISIREFSIFALYVLRGGLFGWSKSGPPSCVFEVWRRLHTRRLEKLGPKQSEHPSVGELCPACKVPFKKGDFTTLVPIGPGDSEEDKRRMKEGRAYIEAAVEVHWGCSEGPIRVGEENE